MGFRIFSSRNGSKQDTRGKATVLPRHSKSENDFGEESVSVQRDVVEQTKSRDTVPCMDSLGSPRFCQSPIQILFDEEGGDQEVEKVMKEDYSLGDLDESQINSAHQQTQSVISEISSTHQQSRSVIPEIYSTHQRSKSVISEPMNSLSQSRKTYASKEDETPQNDPGRPNLPLPPRLREASNRNPLGLSSSTSFREALLGLSCAAPMLGRSNFRTQ